MDVGPVTVSLHRLVQKKGKKKKYISSPQGHQWVTFVEMGSVPVDLPGCSTMLKKFGKGKKIYMFPHRHILCQIGIQILWVLANSRWLFKKQKEERGNFMCAALAKHQSFMFNFSGAC